MAYRIEPVSISVYGKRLDDAETPAVGPRRGAWPMKCKCIAFDDLGMVDEWAWRVKLTLVEA